MSSARSLVGAVLGAVAAGAALRLHAAATAREQSLLETIGELPAIVSDDIARIGDAARDALADGRAAAQQARITFDEQVAGAARRTREHHV